MEFSSSPKVSGVLFDGATESFSVAEITKAFVDLHAAKKALTEEEFRLVKIAFEIFCQKDEARLLDKAGLVALCDELISQFDLIAPYYRFCGENVGIASVAEPMKQLYRLKAKRLLKSGLPFFGKEWEELRKDFAEEFFSRRFFNESDFSY